MDGFILEGLRETISNDSIRGIQLYNFIHTVLVKDFKKEMEKTIKIQKLRIFSET